jgi:hypothetical protein
MLASALNPLLPAALVGTERQAPDYACLTEPLSGLAAPLQNQGASSAAQLLRMAAALSLAGRAGMQGMVSTSDLHAPAAPERLQSLPAGPLAEQLLPWCFHEGTQRLQKWGLSQLASVACRLPFALLPRALDLGRRVAAIRPHLLLVMGERGLWLAAQHEDWAYAKGISGAGEESLENLQMQWAEASAERRQQIFRKLRQLDAKAGREHLLAVLPDLPAQERAQLVAEMQHGLQQQDEAALEIWRTDRSKEVRAQALHLLLRLPQSAFTQRACARMAALMNFEKGLIRKRWVIDAPSQCSDEMKADQIEADRPKSESLGERAWWLYQMARQVPLGWWQQHMQLTPEKLLDWASDTDWRLALQRAWAEGLVNHPDSAWALVLLRTWPKDVPDQRDAVLMMLPAELQEQILQVQFASSKANELTVMVNALSNLPASQTLSLEFSKLLANNLLARLQKPDWGQDYVLRTVLYEIGSLLHLQALPILENVPRYAEETPALAQCMYQLSQTIALRQAMNDFITTRNS